MTLIFSLERHKEVAEAYIRGLERLVEAGGDPAKVGSVASYFVSRVDTEADRRLDEVGHPELKGKLAVANAKLAYQNYKEIFSGERWEALAAKGATPQWCLWASTSTKNPEYRDVLYVEELIGPDTVNTMPRETIEAFQDHGEVELTLEQGIDEAHARVRAGRRGGRRLRRRDRHARARGRAEVHRLLHGAARGDRRETEATRRRVSDLYWEEAGEGPPVVLVHEAVGDSRMWDPQWETFPRSHRTVRFDQRGYGRSPLEPGTISHARDLIDLMDEVGLDAPRSSAARWAGVSCSRSRSRSRIASRSSCC